MQDRSSTDETRSNPPANAGSQGPQQTFGSSIGGSKDIIQTASSNNAFVEQRPQFIQITVQEFPELNYMTLRVSDEFNKYFSNPKSKSTPKVSPPVGDHIVPESHRPQGVIITIQQLQELDLLTPRVFNEYNKHFLNPKPKSLPKVSPPPQLLPKIESDTRQNLAPNQNTNGKVFSNQFPELNLMTSLVGNEFLKYYSNPRPKSTPKLPTPSSTESQLKQEVEAIQNPYSIPNVSVLPLESGPQNTYPGPQSPSSSSSYGVPSQGGDIPVENLDNLNKVGDENVHNRVDDGGDKDSISTGGVGLFHDESASNGEQITSNTQINQVSTSTFGNVTPLPSTQDQEVLPSTNIKSYSPLDNYNKNYYQPTGGLSNESGKTGENAQIPISEALKQLLRPYMGKEGAKKLVQNNAEHNKIENKLFNSDNDQSKNKGKIPLEQDSLAAASVNENFTPRNEPDTSIIFIRPITNTGRRPPTQFHPKQPQSQPGFQHSPEFHSRNQPSYNRQGIDDPNKIFFPGPASQSHPMQRRE